MRWMSRYLLFIVLLFCMVSSYAADTINIAPGTSISAQTMLINIAKQIPNLMRMVTAIAYVLGMYFIVHGIYKLKEYGEQRTMMSSQHDLKVPLTFIVIGALLLYLPTSVQVGLSTFWTAPSPYSYADAQAKDQWTDFLDICFMIIQLVGVIAFIRGLVILSHGSSGGQQGGFGRGITHIIGGIFCINIYQTVKVILVTLGVET